VERGAETTSQSCRRGGEGAYRLGNIRLGRDGDGDGDGDGGGGSNFVGRLLWLGCHVGAFARKALEPLFFCAPRVLPRQPILLGFRHLCLANPRTSQQHSNRAATTEHTCHMPIKGVEGITARSLSLSLCRSCSVSSGNAEVPYLRGADEAEALVPEAWWVWRVGGTSAAVGRRERGASHHAVGVHAMQLARGAACQLPPEPHHAARVTLEQLLRRRPHAWPPHGRTLVVAVALLLVLPLLLLLVGRRPATARRTHIKPMSELLLGRAAEMAGSVGTQLPVLYPALCVCIRWSVPGR
jgi:hypothetical protein